MAPCPYSLRGPAVLPRAVQSQMWIVRHPPLKAGRDLLNYLLSARSAPDFIHGWRIVRHPTLKA